MATRTKKQNQADIGSLIRGAMNVGAGILVHKGVIAASAVEPLSGAVLALASLYLSSRKNKQTLGE
jgi:hypothetical protein